MYYPITKEFSTQWRRSIDSTSNSTEKKIERELSPEEEKVAFLYTSKVNSVRIFSKSLD